MANKRIKDLGTTASTLAADDYVAIDGNANGTRKIVKGDLVNDISTQVAGTYLDEANNLSDVASKDTSKLNLEVPDVGTAPNEVPLNGQLGTMAFQSAEAVSVAKAEVESTTGTGSTQALTVTDGTDTNFVVQEDGRTGINNSSPGTNANGNADDLVVGNGAEHGITIYSGTGASGRLFFSDGTGAATYRGYIRYDHGSNSMLFGTNSSQRWAINSSGALVSSGGGIDFGSVAGGTGTPITNGGLLDDYEAGTFTPQVADATSGGNVGSAATAAGEYTKVGRIVHFSLRLENIDTTGLTAGNTFYIRGLPFVAISGDPQTQLATKTDNVAFNDGIVGGVVSGQSNAFLASLRSGNTDVNRQVSHLTSGTADVYLSGSYTAA